MLTGRVDDFQSGKVFGWAYNSENLDEHLLIRISFGSQVVASGVANMMRPDLPDAGVGEGDHAFEILVPPHIVSLKGLVVMAQSSRLGDAVLPIASNDDRHLDDLFQIFSDRYEEALQAFKSEIDLLRDEVRQDGAPSLDMPENIHKRLTALEHRMESSEVFFVRIDEMMREFTESRSRRKGRGFFDLFKGKG